MKKSMLLTTIAMIVVVVIALSTATFAWFSASSQTAVEGTMTIQAGREFMLNVVDATTPTQWTSATGKIDIANDMGTAENGISPVSPTHSLSAAYGNPSSSGSYYSDPATMDKVPTKNEAGLWYTVKGQSGAYDALANVNTGFAVTSFQVGIGDGKAQTVYLQTTIKTSDSADRLQALKGVRVVYQVTSFDTTGNRTGTAWYGTKYTWGGAGLLQANGTIVTGDTYKTTATGAGSEAAEKDTLTAIISNGAYGTFLPEPTLAAGKSKYATADIFRCSEEANSNKGLYRFMQTPLTFEAAEFKTITVYVWVDGHAVDDQSAKKDISVMVGFSKTSAAA